ncbi:MAG: hypothetical protein Q4A75_02475 [Peptostreptococcaceae bacterium]|nr:hypothetical protein [Peptostreptococcaceae bacterium]
MQHQLIQNIVKEQSALCRLFFVLEMEELPLIVFYKKYLKMKLIL